MWLPVAFASGGAMIAAWVWAIVLLARSSAADLRGLAIPLGVDVGLGAVSLAFAMRSVPNQWISDLPPVWVWWMAVAVGAWLPLSERRLIYGGVTALALLWVAAAGAGHWSVDALSFSPSWWRALSAWAVVGLCGVCILVLARWVRAGMSPPHLGGVVIGIVAYMLPSALLTLAIAIIYNQYPITGLVLVVATSWVGVAGALSVIFGARLAT